MNTWRTLWDTLFARGKSIEPAELPWYERGKERTKLDDFTSYIEAAQRLFLSNPNRPVLRGEWSGTCDLPWSVLQTELSDMVGRGAAIIDHENDPNDFDCVYLTQDGLFRLIYDIDGKDATLAVVTQNEDLYWQVESWSRGRFADAPPQDAVYTIVSARSGFTATMLDFAGAPLVRENYNEGVLQRYDRAIAELNAETPAGRIVILDGVPGVGKTYMVRAMVHDIENAMFIVMPQGMVESLVGPAMIPVLMRLRDDLKKTRVIFVLEDADDALVPRDGGNVHLISALLNFGDGFLGAALNIRVIATTNQPADKIDPAMRRPGRLIEHIHVGAFSAEEAQQVLHNLNPDATLPKKQVRSMGFDNQKAATYTLAELYEAARADTRRD
jgi:hypothetical protein